VRANEERDQQAKDGGDARVELEAAPQREPYTPPVIEKYPPMGNVTFGTNVQPMLAMTLAGA
jgi:hypothetical protein